MKGGILQREIDYPSNFGDFPSESVVVDPIESQDHYFWYFGNSCLFFRRCCAIALPDKFLSQASVVEKLLQMKEMKSKKRKKKVRKKNN